MKEKESALDSSVGRGPNKLDSKSAGAMGSGVAGGGGRPRSNHNGARARRSQGGVDGGVGRDGNGSCTWVRGLSKLDDC